MNYLELRQQERIEKRLSKLRRISFWTSFVALGVIIYDLGFDHSGTTEFYFTNFYLLTLLVGSITVITRYFIRKSKLPIKVKVFDAVILFLFAVLFLTKTEISPVNSVFFEFFKSSNWIYLAVIVCFVREFSTIDINFKKGYVTPAQLFILSFLSLIIIGTLFLMLPKATYESISVLDALFTSTSAV